MLVIPHIANEGHLLAVAWEICLLRFVVLAVGLANQKAAEIIFFIEVGLIGRPTAVNTVQVEAWRAEVV